MTRYLYPCKTIGKKSRTHPLESTAAYARFRLYIGSPAMTDILAFLCNAVDTNARGDYLVTVTSASADIMSESIVRGAVTKATIPDAGPADDDNSQRESRAASSVVALELRMWHDGIGAPKYLAVSSGVLAKTLGRTVDDLACFFLILPLTCHKAIRISFSMRTTCCPRP